MPRYGEGSAVGVSDDWRRYTVPGAVIGAGGLSMANAIRPPVKAVERSVADRRRKASAQLSLAQHQQQGGMLWNGKKIGAKQAKRKVANAQRSMRIADSVAGEAPKVLGKITSPKFRATTGHVGALMVTGGALEAWRRRREALNAQVG